MSNVRVANQFHYGPARVPSRETPEAAIEALLERGYSACEIDFEGRFWMDYDFAARFGELARDNGIVRSLHAPLAGVMGHAHIAIHPNTGRHLSHRGGAWIPPSGA